MRIPTIARAIALMLVFAGVPACGAAAVAGAGAAGGIYLTSRGAKGR
jgi:hypothetical protein